MRIDIDVTMDYQLCGKDLVQLTIEAAQLEGQAILEAALDIDGATVSRISGEGGVGQRVWAHVSNDRLTLRYRAKVDVMRSTVALETLAATPLYALPGDVTTYLRASRFCQSDVFIGFATQKFGHLAGGAKVAAIRNWVAAELTYVPGSSNGSTTARDTFVAREGVCRDYAHMVCCLARAANIPARYASVYGPEVNPSDFHAVAQVWLEGAWHLVDATGMSEAETTVLIGTGRDAGDVAFMETEKWAQLINQRICVTQGPLPTH